MSQEKSYYIPLYKPFLHVYTLTYKAGKPVTENEIMAMFYLRASQCPEHTGSLA